jgi:hypothetical protein
VSHDSRFLDQVCTDIIHYEGRKLRRYKGNLSEFVKKVPEAQSYYSLEVRLACNPRLLHTCYSWTLLCFTIVYVKCLGVFLSSHWLLREFHGLYFTWNYRSPCLSWVPSQICCAY